MAIVLDASVALKLVVAEPGTDAAQRIVDRDEERIAPDWLMAEVASALSGKVRYEGLSAPHAEAALDAMPRFIDRMIGSALFLAPAMRLSIDLSHVFYDCLYLAIAIAEDARLITADKGFVKSVNAVGLDRHVELLTWS